MDGKCSSAERVFICCVHASSAFVLLAPKIVWLRKKCVVGFSSFVKMA